MPYTTLSLESILHHAQIARNTLHIHLVNEINSTNAYCMQAMKQSSQQALVCIAEKQTQGRGRLGKVWHSQEKGNVYFSYAQRIKQGLSHYATFSLSLGISLIQLLKIMRVQNIGLKWPNDLMSCDYQKFGGILIETMSDDNGNTVLVIGIGINVNASEQLKNAFNREVSALNELSTQHVCRHHLLGQLIQCCQRLLANYESGELDNQSIIKAWQQYDLLAGKQVTLYHGRDTLTGIYDGINECGKVRIIKEKQVFTYGAGEVSFEWK